MSRRLHISLLLAAHLLLLLLASSLLVTFFSPLFQLSEIQQFDLARTSIGLALVLLAWVGTLLVQLLWQRRWVGAGSLTLLLVADGLALGGSMLLMASFFHSGTP